MTEEKQKLSYVDKTKVCPEETANITSQGEISWQYKHI